MKQKYVSKIYHLDLTFKYNRGMKLSSNIRLTNNDSLFLEHFGNQRFIEMIGFLEFESFKNSTFLYNFENLDEELNETQRIERLNNFIYKTQSICNVFWIIKDNSINCENGFLYISDSDNEKESFSSNMRSQVFTNAFGERTNVVFNREELSQYVQIYNLLYQDKRLLSGKDVHRYLYNSATRLERFFYFLQAARTQAYLPSKIALYCTMIEVLFCTDDNYEITHKISERIAFFIGENYEDQYNIYKLIKEAYRVRSSTVHGDIMKKDYKEEDNLKRLSKNIDELLRRITMKIINDKDYIHLFENGKKDDLNKFYFDLLFKR